MTLFIVGVVEMILSASWTSFVSRRNAGATGAVTVVNVLIWFYVINQVVNDIGGWTTIASYTLGCAVGAMAGTADWKAITKRCRKAIKKTKRKTGTGVPVSQEA